MSAKVQVLTTMNWIPDDEESYSIQEVHYLYFINTYIDDESAPSINELMCNRIIITA